jgi:phosphate uptake regulator
MTDMAVEAFSRRDRQMCEGSQNSTIASTSSTGRWRATSSLSHATPGRLEWALRILPVSRSLERVADHAVDIAEQAWFLMTGELREPD